MKYNLLSICLIALGMMTSISASAAIPETCDSIAKAKGYADHYCACNYEYTRINSLNSLKNLEFSDSIWFKTSLETFTKAGMTAYLFSESDVQVKIFQQCKNEDSSYSFLVPKNQTRDLDHQAILDKLASFGASNTNAVIYVLFYPVIEGAECRLMCYPYNEGPNSTPDAPLPMLLGMTYVSANSYDVYELHADAIPASYALYSHWMADNNDCQLSITLGTAYGEEVATHDFSTSPYYQFDPAILEQAHLTGTSLFLHYTHNNVDHGRLDVREADIEEVVTDTTICQGKSFDINGLSITEPSTYTYRAWINNTTYGIYRYNILFSAPEVQYDTIRVNAADLPILYRNQYTIPNNGLCDFDLTIHNDGECDERYLLHVIRETEESATICHGETYEWNGQTYAATGDYTATLSNAQGCDSVVTLHLIVLPEVPATEESDTVCYGETYKWNGQTYSATGDYTATLQNAQGCDSVVVLHLTVLPEVPATEETATICHGETYEWNGQTYAATGDYTATLQNAQGCDSVVVLHLTMLPEVPATEENATICSGETYTWQGQTYAESGDYSVTYSDVNGCDSIVILHLNVLPDESTSEETFVACDSYLWYGTTYTESGDYTYTTTSDNGCEHTVTLHLTINKSVATEETIAACTSYEWNGTTYTESGDYTITLSTATGCDSVVTLHLTVWPEVPTTEESATVCYGETYEWNGQTYAATGDYTATLQNIHGCDSVVVLHLTVLPEVLMTEETVIVCHGETYTWEGQTYTESGDYTVTYADKNGCDSTLVLHLTVLPEEAKKETTVAACDSYEWYGVTYTESGDYTYNGTTSTGCNYTEVLHLTINLSEQVEETVTACDSYEWHGMTYTESGDYIFNTTTDAGCDRVETLHLTINLSEQVEETVTACDSYEWHGMTYTESGDYTYNGTTDAGCDRVETLHLTINLSEQVEETVTACDSYEWHGMTYTESGDYTYNGTTSTGCNYTEVLHLTINLSEQVEETVAACDSYEWHGMTYTESGDYTYNGTTSTGCNYTEVLHLTINLSEQVEETVAACDSYEWHGETYTVSGDYIFNTTTDAGCERVETLHLTINLSEQVEETVTACDSYEWHGMTYTESGDYTYNGTTDAGCERVETLHLTIETCSAVEDVPANAADIRKVVRGDQVLIIREGKVYTLMGVEVK